MKKFLIVLCLISSTAQAKVYCEDAGGISWIGEDGSTKYCVSRHTMNWWTVHSWCEEIGGTLFDITKECSKSSYPATCTQLKKEKSPYRYLWTMNVVSSSQALRYDINEQGAFQTYAKNGLCHALCTLTAE